MEAPGGPKPPMKIKHQVPLCLQEVGHVTKRPSRANRRSDLLARSILPATVYPSVVPGPYIPPEYSHIITGAAAGASATLPSSNPPSSASTSAPKTPTTPVEPSQATSSSNSEFDNDSECLPEMDEPEQGSRKSMLSEREILETYFNPDLREASKKDHQWKDIGWCTISETRLLKRLALHKPAGVFRGLEMIALVNDMHRITENDPLTDYRDELTPEDYEIYLRRVESGEAQKNPRCYSPAYKVRPNHKAIVNKLSEYFDLKKVHDMEMRANPVDSYFKQKDFELPPDLLKMKNAIPH
uniref:ETS domain-containing protein n=1 Tax=Steinernema glaseri TaxID=37863 RepID=A0A1I7YRJ2_9BILA